MDEELTVGETAERLGISTVLVWRVVRESVLTSRPNALDRRERLTSVAGIEALEGRGRRKRGQPAAP
jgi:hypothetical protein